jgi:electron transport complex protein RnfB
MRPTAEDIDAILPQTQCGLCTYKGCMPYAEALAQDQAAIDLCPPGGVKGLLAMANLLQKDPSPYLAEMEKKAKIPLKAVIREAECIGCTKCIQACPVDAILGTGKLMHTVIAEDCTGCELCVAPCPVDCIDMVPAPENDLTQRNHFRKRYQARNQRLLKKDEPEVVIDKKAYIQAAILRAKQKKKG